MTAILSNKYLLFTIRIILGVLFIYSAITKITDLDYFAKSLYNYRLLPEELLNFFALIIPWLELIVGLLLIIGIYTRESALLGSILMIIFIGAVGIALARGLDIECGCFGTRDGSRVGFLKIIEDVLILLGFIWLSVYGSGFLALIKSADNSKKTESSF